MILLPVHASCIPEYLLQKDVYKYAMDMLKYAEDSIKDEVSRFVKELEEIIENNLDINKQLIEKADIIVHKIRMDE